MNQTHMQDSLYLCMATIRSLSQHLLSMFTSLDQMDDDQPQDGHRVNLNESSSSSLCNCIHKCSCEPKSDRFEFVSNMVSDSDSTVDNQKMHVNCCSAIDNDLLEGRFLEKKYNNYRYLSMKYNPWKPYQIIMNNIAPSFKCNDDKAQRNKTTQTRTSSLDEDKIDFLKAHEWVEKKKLSDDKEQEKLVTENATQVENINFLKFVDATDVKQNQDRTDLALEFDGTIIKSSGKSASFLEKGENPNFLKFPDSNDVKQNQERADLALEFDGTIIKSSEKSRKWASFLIVELENERNLTNELEKKLFECLNERENKTRQEIKGTTISNSVNEVGIISNTVEYLDLPQIETNILSIDRENKFISKHSVSEDRLENTIVVENPLIIFCSIDDGIKEVDSMTRDEDIRVIPFIDDRNSSTIFSKNTVVTSDELFNHFPPVDNLENTSEVIELNNEEQTDVAVMPLSKHEDQQIKSERRTSSINVMEKRLSSKSPGPLLKLEKSLKHNLDDMLYQPLIKMEHNKDGSPSGNSILSPSNLSVKDKNEQMSQTIENNKISELNKINNLEALENESLIKPDNINHSKENINSENSLRNIIKQIYETKDKLSENVLNLSVSVKSQTSISGNKINYSDREDKTSSKKSKLSQTSLENNDDFVTHIKSKETSLKNDKDSKSRKSNRESLFSEILPLLISQTNIEYEQKNSVVNTTVNSKGSQASFRNDHLEVNEIHFNDADPILNNSKGSNLGEPLPQQVVTISSKDGHEEKSKTSLKHSQTTEKNDLAFVHESNNQEHKMSPQSSNASLKQDRNTEKRSSYLEDRISTNRNLVSTNADIKSYKKEDSLKNSLPHMEQSTSAKDMKPADGIATDKESNCDDVLHIELVIDCFESSKCNGIYKTGTHSQEEKKSDKYNNFEHMTSPQSTVISDKRPDHFSDSKHEISLSNVNRPRNSQENDTKISENSGNKNRGSFASIKIGDQSFVLPIIEETRSSERLSGKVSKKHLSNKNFIHVSKNHSTDKSQTSNKINVKGGSVLEGQDLLDLQVKEYLDSLVENIKRTLEAENIEKEPVRFSQISAFETEKGGFQNKPNYSKNLQLKEIRNADMPLMEEFSKPETVDTIETKVTGEIENVSSDDVEKIGQFIKPKQKKRASGKIELIFKQKISKKSEKDSYEENHHPDINESHKGKSLSTLSTVTTNSSVIKSTDFWISSDGSLATLFMPIKLASAQSNGLTIGLSQKTSCCDWRTSFSTVDLLLSSSSVPNTEYKNLDATLKNESSHLTDKDDDFLSYSIGNDLLTGSRSKSDMFLYPNRKSNELNENNQTEDNSFPLNICFGNNPSNILQYDSIVVQHGKFNIKTVSTCSNIDLLSHHDRNTSTIITNISQSNNFVAVVSPTVEQIPNRIKSTIDEPEEVCMDVSIVFSNSTELCTNTDISYSRDTKPQMSVVLEASPLTYFTFDRMKKLTSEMVLKTNSNVSQRSQMSCFAFL